MEAQNKQELWDSLEQQQLPENRLIYGLSGMLSGELQRFRSAWDALLPLTKRHLMTSLTDIAEADFSMDFSDIFSIALDSDDPEICILAMDGLAESEDIRLLQRLTHTLKFGKNESVRAKAAETMASFVLLGELGKMREHTFYNTVTLLIDTFNNPNESVEVRRRAIEAVAYTGTNDVPELIQTAYTSSDEKMSISAVFAMGRSTDKRWSASIRKELVNINPVMRFEATCACGDLQIRESIPDLIELTDDIDIQVQVMAIGSLGQIGGTRARRTLQKILDSDNEALYSAAQQAIDELDFFQDDPSTFLGPPSEYSGEGEDSWLTPEGLPFREAEDVEYDIEDEVMNDFTTEENLWESEE